MMVYLAGPMRSIAQFNFPAFDKAAKELRAAGYEVFNPADRDRDKAGFNPEGMTGHEDLAGLGFDLRDALAADTDWISRKAEAVAVLPGWENSSGARAEVALAHALGLPVAPWDKFNITGGAPADRWLIKPATPPSGSLKPTDNDYAAALRDVQAGKLSYDEARDRLYMPPYGPPAVAGGTISASTNGEVRTTSSTGGEKGAKPERFDLIPTGALAKVAQLYGRGARKYAAHNWRKGYEWSKSYAALQRHATQFWGGEDIDDEMQLPHLAAVVFHALTLLTFMDEQKAFDDRYKAGA